MALLAAAGLPAHAAVVTGVTVTGYNCNAGTGLPENINITYTGTYATDDGGGADAIYLQVLDGNGTVLLTSFATVPNGSLAHFQVIIGFVSPLPDLDPLVFEVYESTGAPNIGALLNTASLTTGCPALNPVTAPATTATQPDGRSGLCYQVDALTEGQIRVGSPASTIYATLCRVIALGGSYLRTPGEIGVQGVIDLGVIHAVDVWSGGQTFAQTLVCMQGEGSLIFLDAANAPRTASVLQVVVIDDYSCGWLTAPGTVVLVRRSPG
jgi:hypothetical protein